MRSALPAAAEAQVPWLLDWRLPELTMFAFGTLLDVLNV